MSSTDRITSDDVVAWIQLAADVFRGEKEHLTELDSAIGDADHGINMDRGFQAVVAKLPTLPQDDIGALLKGVGMTLMSTVGGASGPLYGSFFLQLGNATAGKSDIDVAEFAAAMDNGIARVQGLGKAEAGDKTMLDALFPAQAALHHAADAGENPSAALGAAAEAAEEGMRATIPLVARKGRASYLGDRSAGHQDPGATSTSLLLKAAADAWSRD
ncbi:MAG TPA: dihydroxyacetone kinase subunit DhaL [Candidatus Limnocylindrales bacterium]|jgi:dihydroxyacetone kinase-like protein|nr:dihydroxyacetone kinase subunit DhaL [Candidatus Limnocylindrales bacterium]